jgi:hypothetical protein
MNLVVNFCAFVMMVPLLHDGMCTFNQCSMARWTLFATSQSFMVLHNLNTTTKLIRIFLILEFSIEPKLMEGFEGTYHLWIIYDVWKSRITYFFFTQMDLLDSCSQKVTFYATFVLLT